MCGFVAASKRTVEAALGVEADQPSYSRLSDRRDQPWKVALIAVPLRDPWVRVLVEYTTLGLRRHGAVEQVIYSASEKTGSGFAGIGYRNFCAARH